MLTHVHTHVTETVTCTITWRDRYPCHQHVCV